MNELIGNLPRRGFLQGLARLPLIGGSVTILGAPVKADVPITDQLLKTYEQWLDFEHRMLRAEMHGSTIEDGGRPLALTGWRYHFPPQPDGSPFIGWEHVPAPLQPSARAAAVLSAVGCFETVPENMDYRLSVANISRVIRDRENRNG